METQTNKKLLLQIEELQNRLAEADQHIEAIKAGEVDAFALNINNKPEIFTLKSGDYAYRVLVENFREGALNLAEDGLIVYTNTSFCKILELPYEKVIGQNISQFIHPDSIETFKELFKKGLAGQSVGEINLIVGNKSCPVYVSLTSLYPNLPTVGVIVSDLTETKQAIIELEAKKNLQNIFKSVPGATAVYEGPEHIYILANKAYEKLTNRKAADLLGKSIRDVFPELKGTGTFELFDHVFKTGETFVAPEYTTMIDIRNDGVLRQGYFNFSIEPLKNDSGGIYAVIAMTYDITEQVELRKKSEESEKQQAFLLNLSDALRLLSAPQQIKIKAMQVLGEHLNVSRCYYAEVTNDGKHCVIDNSFSSGHGTIDGTYRLEDFGKAKVAVLQRGEVLMTADVANDTSVTQEERERNLEMQIHAYINVPLVKDNKLICLLGVNQSVVRHWTALDLTIVQETAERTWAAIARAKAEEALIVSEEKYRNLFTSIDQGFTLCELIRNKEGKGIDFYILDVNPTYEKQTGVSKEMVLGKPLLQVFPTINNLIETYAAVVDNQSPVVFEHYFDVTDRWFAIKAYPVEKEKFAVLFSDITERKQADNKIKESEENFRQLAELLPQKISQADEAGNLFYYNQSWLSYSGLSMEDLKNAGWEQVMHPDERDEIVERWQHSVKTGINFEMEMQLLNKNGEYKWHLSRASGIKDDEGNIVKWIGAAIEIQKQVEQRTELETAVNNRTNELKNANQELQNMNKELEAFAFVSSHDLQEPLRKIKNFVNILVDEEKDSLSDSGKHYLERTYYTAQRMQSLIEDLLSYSRLNKGEMKFERTDLNTILNQVKDDLKERIRETHAVIDAQELCEINIIPFQFRQLLNNLISNALKFTREGVTPHIAIKSEIEKGKQLPKASYCHISISDNGIGFDPQYNERIFEVFQRLHGQEQYKGTGIGLAICKKIVENHNGVITATGRLNEGTRFDIYLPVE